MSELDRLGPSWKPLRWLTNTGPGNLMLLVGILVMAMGAPLVFAIMGNKGAFAYFQMLPPLATVSTIMALKYGSPLNWWSPFFGVDQKVNRDRIAVRERAGEDPSALQKEIAQWVKECTKGRSVEINPYKYRFLRKGDAMFFKLTWG